ncbi:MAG: hypothetical protein WD274_08190 [Acidimicrobiia bacterium]
MRRGHETTNQIGLALLGSSLLVAAIAATSVQDGSALGAPGYWAWILTGLQVAALRTAATGKDWGWLLGASVQLPWIAYALATAQIGFIPGCLVSAAVQAHGYLGRRPGTARFEEPTYA